MIRGDPVAFGRPLRAALPAFGPSLFHVSALCVGIPDAVRFYCPGCFNWKHSFWRAAKGFLAWHLVCRPWMHISGFRSVPPFLAIAGDWIYDTRGCGCGVPLVADARKSATGSKTEGGEQPGPAADFATHQPEGPSKQPLGGGF